jgi:hypothetical protein
MEAGKLYVVFFLVKNLIFTIFSHKTIEITPPKHKKKKKPITIKKI